MINVMLKVTYKEGTDMFALVTQMCKLNNCRIKVDKEKGEISIFNMSDSEVENIITAIKETFDISNISIEPSDNFDEAEQSDNTTNKVSVTSKIDNYAVEKKMEELVEVINKAFGQKAKVYDIVDYLSSTIFEISTKYNPKTLRHQFSTGEIVVCNFGFHLKNENSGSLNCIICDICNNGLVYVVPVRKKDYDPNVGIHLPFTANVDVKYNNGIDYPGGIACLEKGQYVSRRRLGKTVGYVLPEFFEKIITRLPESVNFSSKCNDCENIVAEQIEDVDESKDIVVLASSKEVRGEDNSKMTTEEYFRKIPKVSDGLKGVNNFKSPADQVEYFLETIGFGEDSMHYEDVVYKDIIRNAFIAACNIERVNYNSIIDKVHEMKREYTKSLIKDALVTQFAKWIEPYAEAREKYPRANLVVLLKLFAKSFSN